MCQIDSVKEAKISKICLQNRYYTKTYVENKSYFVRTYGVYYISQ